MGMNSDSSSSDLRVGKSIFWIIWAAMLSSIVIYVFVLKFSGPGVDEAASEKNGFDLRTVLLPIAIGAIAVSLAIRFFITPRFLKQTEGGLSQKLFSSFIVSLALAESAAIYGLVLGMQGTPFKDCLLFFALGFVTIVLLAPVFLFESKGEEARAKLRQG